MLKSVMGRGFCSYVTVKVEKDEMKVALVFLLKLSWKKPWSPVLNMNLFSFFYYSFYLYKLFHLFAIVLLMRFIVLEDSISPLMMIKSASLCGLTSAKNASKITEFWPLSLQPAELLYFTAIFMLNGEQLFTCFTYNCFIFSQSWYSVKTMVAINVTLLNKTDVQNFSRMCFTKCVLNLHLSQQPERQSLRTSLFLIILLVSTQIKVTVAN